MDSFLIQEDFNINENNFDSLYAYFNKHKINPRVLIAKESNLHKLTKIFGNINNLQSNGIKKIDFLINEYINSIIKGLKNWNTAIKVFI